MIMHIPNEKIFRKQRYHKIHFNIGDIFLRNINKHSYLNWFKMNDSVRWLLLKVHGVSRGFVRFDDNDGFKRFRIECTSLMNF